MITQKHIQLHGKCLAILGMIQTANERITRAKIEVRNYDNGDPMNFSRLFIDRDELVDKIDRYARVKNRLVRYYADTMTQIIEPVIIKTLNNEYINSGATGTQTPGEGFFRTPRGTAKIQGTTGETGQFVHDQRSADSGIKQPVDKS